MANAVSPFYYSPFTGYPTLFYQWVSKVLTSGGANVTLGGGGGGGGQYAGPGATNAGNGSAAFGQDYYSYPAGLGGAGTYYGAGGGGGGKASGGGGPGYSGVVIIAYVTGDYTNPTGN